MAEAPRINYNAMVPDPIDAVRAERDRAQRACEHMGRRMSRMEAGILRALALIETETEPDIDALHDALGDALLAKTEAE